MTALDPWQWMASQRARGHVIAVMLDEDAQARRPMMGALPSERWCALYDATPAAQLAAHGPLCLLVDASEMRLLQDDLGAPQRHWGWLASLAPGSWPAWLEHWRQRLMVGPVLYRLHDNRVLARAIAALSAAELPAYLGPSISLCYWQGEAWAVTDNPAPGNYPVPVDPAWLHVPAPGEGATLLANADRYLCRHHYDRYLLLAAQQAPDVWLGAVLEQARAWDWLAPQRFELLLLHSLYASEFKLGGEWAPQPGEPSHLHFERVKREFQLNLTGSSV